MSGDYSRDSFDALHDYAGVLLQQGRAVLDSDWTELVQIITRRIRAGTIDTIGRAVVPRETEDGFRIVTDGTGSFGIMRGRMYVDGECLENHGAADFHGAAPDLEPPVFDRSRPGDDGPEGVLDEMISPEDGDIVPYEAQPYWPTPEALPGEEGAHLAYVVTWQREVTPIEAPGLLEPALGGIDTTTRLQTVWQVRLLADVGDDATCATPDDELSGWARLIAPSTARLTTATIDIEDPEDPCLVPPTEGYTGLENQLYRVELHSVGDEQGDARFKFSRENASVTAAIESMGDPADRVTVARIGRDEVLRFRPGDWVEVTDDHREFNHRSGRMLRVAEVLEETRQIVFEEAIDAAAGNDDLIPTDAGGDTVAARHSRLIRWDQAGIIRLADGTELTNLDDENSDGLIPVPGDGVAVVLESGITVSFSTADGPGGFREMDHWRFAARTAGTQVEDLRAAPPDGIQRHYARLAIIRFPNSVIDCRVFWPPEFEAPAEGCFCTVCVTAEGHNSGALTIQAAIDQVGALGGRVCLEAGSYILTSPVVIDGRLGLSVTGQGIGTILVFSGSGAAIRVTGSFDVELERFTLFVLPTAEDDGGAIPPTHGITAMNSALVALRRLAVIVLGANPEDRFDFAIAFDGVQIGAKVEECVALAPIALGSRSSFDLDVEEPDDPVFVAFAELRVLDCILFGGREAVRFDRMALNVAAAVLARNLMSGEQVGVRIGWAEMPGAGTAIEASTIQSGRDAIILGASDVRLQDCQISGGTQSGHGIRLVPSLVPEIATDTQVIGNAIFDLAGAGLRIEGNHRSLLVKRNVIRRCGEAGITTVPEAEIAHAAIENNVIEEIADLTGQPGAGGIILTSANAGQIVGNTVGPVGRGGIEGQAYFGIAVQGVGSIGIAGNVVGDIGPAAPETIATAIFAGSPYRQLAVAENRLPVETQPSGSRTGWTGIAVGLFQPRITPSGGLGPAPTGFLAAVPGFAQTDLAFFIVDDNLFGLSPARFAILQPRPTSQIRVGGNQIESAVAIRGPTVRILDAGAIALDFSQNQILLTSTGGQSEVVFLGSRRMTVNANSVQHSTDAISMRLVTDQERSATPIGNITSSRIILNSGAVPAPFDALNLIN